MSAIQGNNGDSFDNDFSSNINIVNHNNPDFHEPNNINEEQWIHILFLISDTQIWLEELQAKLIYQIAYSA